MLSVQAKYPILYLLVMRREKIGFILGPLIFIILVLLPPLPYSHEAAQKIGVHPIDISIALGVLLWTAIWWISECVPLGLAALIPPIVFGFAGIVGWKTSLMLFMHPIIWIFMAGFVFTKAFQKWGLDKRIALRLSLIYKGSDPRLSALFSVALPAFLLTFTGSITAATSIVFPIAIAYLNTLGEKKDPLFDEAVMLLLGQAATAGAMFLLISTPPNLIGKSVLEESILDLVEKGLLPSRFKNFSLTFFDWFIVGTPQAFIGLIIVWLTVFLVLKPDLSTVKINRKYVEDELKSLGKMKIEEKIVLAVFALTITLWMAPGIALILSNVMPQYMSLAKTVSTILPEAAPAALAIFLLGLIRVKNKTLLSWSDIERGIDWNVVFLFGGGLALGKGLDYSGFSMWLGDLIMAVAGSQLNIYTITIISAVLGFLITYPASNTASTVISAPIAASMAIAAGINPLPAVVATSLACSISSALPSTTPPMAIVYGSKKIRLVDMFKVGMISDLIRLVVLLITIPYLSELLLQFKGLPVYLGK